MVETLHFVAIAAFLFWCLVSALSEDGWGAEPHDATGLARTGHCGLDAVAGGALRPTRADVRLLAQPEPVVRAERTAGCSRPCCIRLEGPTRTRCSSPSCGAHRIAAAVFVSDVHDTGTGNDTLNHRRWAVQRLVGERCRSEDPVRDWAGRGHRTGQAGRNRRPLGGIGVDSLWFSELVSTDAVDPFIGMAYALARTTQLKVGTSVAILPGRHPVLVAKQLASLAGLAPKRVLPVFGLRSAIPGEREIFDVPDGERAAVFDESLQLLRRYLRRTA